MAAGDDVLRRLVEYARNAPVRPQDFTARRRARQSIAFRIEMGRTDAIERPEGLSLTLYADSISIIGPVSGHVEALTVGDVRYVIDEPVARFGPSPGGVFAAPIEIPVCAPFAVHFRDVALGDAKAICGALFGFLDRELAWRRCAAAERPIVVVRAG